MKKEYMAMGFCIKIDCEKENKHEDIYVDTPRSCLL